MKFIKKFFIIFWYGSDYYNDNYIDDNYIKKDKNMKDEKNKVIQSLPDLINSLLIPLFKLIILILITIFMIGILMDEYSFFPKNIYIKTPQPFKIYESNRFGH